MSRLKTNARWLAVSVDGCLWDEASLVERLTEALRGRRLLAILKARLKMIQRQIHRELPRSTRALP